MQPLLPVVVTRKVPCEVTVIDLSEDVVVHKYALATDEVSTTEGLLDPKMVELLVLIVGFTGAVKSETVLIEDIAEHVDPE